MAARELPPVRRFWARHERRLLEVFQRALQTLQGYSDLPNDENEISKHLTVAVREAAHTLGLDYPPKWELPRQADSEAGVDNTGVGKRPDFTCEVRDIAATSSTEAWLYYHVECKCLGEPSSRTWIYNKNYVDKGIRRFLDPEYGYGEGVSSGAMIGYVLSMNFARIREEVNGHLDEPYAFGFARPIRIPDTRKGGIAKTDQALDRARVLPRRFILRHLWVDLRNR